MKQILIIHGGTSFSSQKAYKEYLDKKVLNYEKLVNPIRWKERLALELKDYDVIYPTMPNGMNAVYNEWKIYFEKIIPFLKDDVQIIGHSLGAMFLAKYLQEHPLKNRVKRLILVSGGYDDDSQEDLGSFKVKSAKDLPKSAVEVHLFHSEDDPLVPYAELAKFKNDIPRAIVHSFKTRGHFIDPTFPEMLELVTQK